MGLEQVSTISSVSHDVWNTSPGFCHATWLCSLEGSTSTTLRMCLLLCDDMRQLCVSCLRQAMNGSHETVSGGRPSSRSQLSLPLLSAIYVSWKAGVRGVPYGRILCHWGVIWLPLRLPWPATCSMEGGKCFLLFRVAWCLAVPL